MSLVWSGPKETWLQSSLSDGGDRRDLTQGWEGRTRGVVSKYDTWARMDPEFWTIFIISEVFFLFVVTERNQKQCYCVGCFPVPVQPCMCGR